MKRPVKGLTHIRLLFTKIMRTLYATDAVRVNGEHGESCAPGIRSPLRQFSRDYQAISPIPCALKYAFVFENGFEPKKPR